MGNRLWWCPATQCDKKFVKTKAKQGEGEQEGKEQVEEEGEEEVVKQAEHSTATAEQEVSEKKLKKV